MVAFPKAATPNTMSFASLRMPKLGFRSASQRALWRRVGRVAALVGGGLLVVIGLVGSLLPGHLGLPVLVLGLIVVLRTSRPARRGFIGLQRRHPRIVFPIRRLLRREPQVFQVVWQQMLRVERMVIPRGWRFFRRSRKGLFKRGA
jgi:hypothetical protein